MERYAPDRGSGSDPGSGVLLSALSRRREEWHLQHAGRRSGARETGLDEAMWRMTLQSQEGMDYPVRLGEPDCAYYMRTGLCGFGRSCRFNHPPNRMLASTAVRGQGEYPERLGQPECQYYLKTGTCKFGATCKFHHPQDTARLWGRAQLNMLNLPLRLGERDCPYYMRTGTCKFGVSCKFNHPQPAAAGPLVSIPGSLFFPGTGPSGSAPALQPYPAGLPTWPIASGPYLSSPRMQGPSSITSVFLPSPRSVVSMPGWSSLSGPVASSDHRQQALRPSYIYGPTVHQDPGLYAPFSAYMPPSGALGLSTPPSSISPRDAPYPDRPGQPECQYYMKTGECKFGRACRFNHPRERISLSAHAWSPMGLPLRPGAPLCTFYARHGFCKFGPTCKYDHPFFSSPSRTLASSLPDMSTITYSAGSSHATLLSSSTETTLILQPSRTSLPGDPASDSGIQVRHRQAPLRDNLEEGVSSGMISGIPAHAGQGMSMPSSS